MGNKSIKSKLSSETEDFLLRNTKFDKSTIKDWYSGFKRECPSGQLTPEMFVNMYSQVFPQGNAEQFSAHAFRTFDTDGSGTIDFREFLLALHITSEGTAQEKLKWAFKMYDVDGNGSIDIQEMKRVIQGVYQMLGVESTVMQVEEVFLRMDLDKDGAVTEEEFMSACATDSDLMQLLTPNMTR